MPTVTQSLEIPAAPEQVWEIATDWSRYGEWNVTHTGFPEGPPSADQGATFKERITIMGMPGEASWTVAESSAPMRTVWAGEGPMGITLGTRLELAADRRRDHGEHLDQLRRRPAGRPDRRDRRPLGAEGSARVAAAAARHGRVSTSLIYRSAAGYELVMRALYGRHYAARMRAVAAQVPDGAAVLELCCGPGTLYTHYLRGHVSAYIGLDLNQRFVAQLREQGVDARNVDLANTAEALPRPMSP